MSDKRVESKAIDNYNTRGVLILVGVWLPGKGFEKKPDQSLLRHTLLSNIEQE